MEPAETVRELFDRMQARDWVGAAAVMSPDAHIRYPATGERFTGAQFMAMNEAYPEGWQLEIVDLIAGGPRVAVQIRVPNGGQTDWLSGFYTVRDGLIVDGVEHWLTDSAETAPVWRAPFTTTDR